MGVFMKRSLTVLGIVMLFVCIFCMAPADADAASYKAVAMEYTFKGEPEKVQANGYYFWLDSDNNLKASKSKSAKGKTLYKSVYGETSVDRFIVTNGEKVYFMVADFKADKVMLYRVNTDGTKRTRLKSMDYADGDLQYKLLAVAYNNVYYYKSGSKGGEAVSSLCAYNIKSKKISTKVKNFREGKTKGNGRYIYYSTGAYDANGNYALKAYDTKNNKAITVAKDGRYLAQYDGKLYYTRDIWDEAAGLTYTQIYEAKTSGKEAALIAELGPIGGSYKLKVKDGTVYYYHEIMDGANTVYNTYMFNLKDKTEDMAMGRETYNAVPELYVNLY